MKKIHLKSNYKKSNIIKYTRKKNKNNVFDENKTVLMENNKVPINNKTKFVGFYLNFNITDYIKYHLKMKLTNFRGLKISLISKKILGNEISLQNQNTYYLDSTRLASIYGLS